MYVAVLSVPEADAEQAADRMWMAGAQGVEERTVGDRIELLAVLGDSTEEVRPRLGPLPVDWVLRFDDVDPQPAETWREYVAPVAVAPDVIVRPAWLTPVGAPIEVAIEPAGSFGLGDHPTTRLCAVALRRVINGGEAVLDVGCGSGVLSVLAVKFGATSARGTDIASLAVAATFDNAWRNGVAEQVSASTASLHEIDESFDVIVANILAPTLRALADDLRERLDGDGTLIVSGLIDGGYDSVVESLAPLSVVSIDRLDGWVALTLRPPAVHA